MSLDAWRRICAGTFVCLLAATVANGAVIQVSDVEVVPGTPSVDIPVTISGGAEITDMAFYVQVGDGGTVKGNAPVPKILAFDFTGSIWGSPDNYDASNGFAPPEEMPDVSLNLKGGVPPVIADGLLVTLVLDTSGMAEGESYTISLVQDWETQTRTEVKGVNATSVDTQLVGGTVNLTPEPTAMAVLGLGSLLALRRRRR